MNLFLEIPFESIAWITGAICILSLLAFLRGRRVTRAERRALKELSRITALSHLHANLFRGDRLRGKWRGRATVVEHGFGGLRVTMSLPGVPRGEAQIRYPAVRGAPVLGFSREIEAHYDIVGDRTILERLADLAPALDELKNQSGDFRLRIGSPRALMRRRTGRAVFVTSVSVTSAEQIRGIIEAIRRIADRMETGTRD